MYNSDSYEMWQYGIEEERFSKVEVSLMRDHMEGILESLYGEGTMEELEISVEELAAHLGIDYVKNKLRIYKQKPTVTSATESIDDKSPI